MRDRRETPSGGEALLCFALMLSCAWFLIQWMAGKPAFAMVTGQVAFVLTPPLAMAFLLTSSPRKTLRLYWPTAGYVLLALGLAAALHPLVRELGFWVERFFPIDEKTKLLLEAMIKSVPNTLTLFIMFAAVPSVCEEFAFRGFILSGLLRTYRARTAIILSALLFGFMHMLMSLNQQVFNSILMGLLLGLLAVRSGSLLPGILFHLTHNGLAVLAGKLTETGTAPRLLPWLFRDAPQGLYHWYWLVFGAIASATLIRRLVRGAATTALPANEPANRALVEVHG